MIEPNDPRETSSCTFEGSAVDVAAELPFQEEAPPLSGDDATLFVLFHEEEIAELMSEGLLRREAPPR